MGRFVFLFAFFFLAACTGKGGSKSAPSEAAFFTSQKAWCTIEEDGKDKSDKIERFGEVYSFSGNTLTIRSFDLDKDNRLQLNPKSQPIIKVWETVKFRVEKGSVYFMADEERRTEYTKLTKDFDGKKQTCFQLKGSYTTTHCPCELPEAR